MRLRTSSFGLVPYERRRYRRRGSASIAPADDRFGIVNGFWSPLAARHGLRALAPAGDCAEMFGELGDMSPSATALNHLVETVGAAWEMLESIRSAEVIPAETAALSISLDGAMLGMRNEKDEAPQDEPVRAAATGFPGGVIGHGFLSRRRRRTAAHGLFRPDAGSGQGKPETRACGGSAACHRVTSEPGGSVNRRRSLRQLDVFLGSVPRGDGNPRFLACGAASEESAGQRLRGTCAGSAAPFREASAAPAGRGERHRSGPPLAAPPGEEISEAQDHLQGVEVLPQAPASDALRQRSKPASCRSARASSRPPIACWWPRG